MSKTRIVNVQDAKAHLSRLLREVEAGEQIAIARAGRVVARIIRAPEANERQWGCFEGKVTYDDDAFAPADVAQAADWDDAPLITGRPKP